MLSATPWPPAGELCYFSSASPFSGSLRFLLSEADPALGPQTTLTDFISRKICRWSYSQDWYNSTFKQFQPACLKYLHLSARSEGSCFGRDASFTPGVGAIFFIISLMFLDFYDEIDLSLQFKGIPAPLEMLLYRQSQWWPSLAGTILARSKLKLISFLQQCDCEIIIIIIIACHHHYLQVMVDWSKIVKNAQCVDKFVVWMWWVSFSRIFIHISIWWTIHDYLFEIQKQSRPDGTERIGKSAVSKEVAHSILPSFEYCNEENWKESTHWKPTIMPGRF